MSRITSFLLSPIPCIDTSVNEVYPSLKYSGGDVTAMPIIGKLTTFKIGEEDETLYDVVEILEDQDKQKVYIANFWIKEGRLPQIIHSVLVKEYNPI